MDGHCYIRLKTSRYNIINPGTIHSLNSVTTAWYDKTAKPRFLIYSRDTISYSTLKLLRNLSEPSSHSRGQWVRRLLFRVQDDHLELRPVLDHEEAVTSAPAMSTIHGRQTPVRIEGYPTLTQDRRSLLLVPHAR